MAHDDRREISERTGFDHGVEFTSRAQVRAYFTRESLAAAIDCSAPDIADALPDQQTLDAYADAVIEHRWHCAFS